MAGNGNGNATGTENKVCLLYTETQIYSHFYKGEEGENICELLVKNTENTTLGVSFSKEERIAMRFFDYNNKELWVTTDALHDNVSTPFKVGANVSRIVLTAPSNVYFCATSRG